MNPDQIYEKLKTAGEEWADAESAAGLLEEMKHTVLSQCAAKWPQDSMSSAESKARRDEDYIRHLESMTTARKEANKAKVKYFSIQAWCDFKRTLEATNRAKIQKGIDA